MKYKEKIIWAIIGAVVLATAFLGYTFYREIGLVSQDHQILGQIVDLINKNQPAK